MTKLILAHVLQDGGPCGGIGRELRTLSDDDNGKVAAAFMALANRFGNFVDVKWPFRNQDHIGPAGDTAVQRNPTRVAPHHFYYHHTVVSLGRRVKAVDRLAHSVAGPIES